MKGTGYITKKEETWGVIPIELFDGNSDLTHSVKFIRLQKSYQNRLSEGSYISFYTTSMNLDDIRETGEGFLNNFCHWAIPILSDEHKNPNAMELLRNHIINSKHELNRIFENQKDSNDLKLVNSVLDDIVDLIENQFIPMSIQEIKNTLES